MTQRKYGTKPNLKAQQRNVAKRDDGPGLDWLTDGVPEHELYRQENVDIYPAAPRTFGKRDESGYSREELIQDKAREDARTIDGEDI